MSDKQYICLKNCLCLLCQLSKHDDIIYKKISGKHSLDGNLGNGNHKTQIKQGDVYYPSTRVNQVFVNIVSKRPQEQFNKKRKKDI